MPNYRRHYFPNSCVFVTVITNKRIPLFLHKENSEIFFNTLSKVEQLYPFKLYAYVLMLDHFHWIIRLLDDSQDFSKIVHSFKRNFTINYKEANHIESPIAIWQKRFWDHIIRDEQDLQNHLDYIHWNPVKHKIVSSPSEYEFSSFREFVDQGFYGKDWGTKEIPASIDNVDSE
jgi:putative transposase